MPATHTTTHCDTHCNNTLQQHTATGGAHRCLQHTLRRTATTHCNNTLQQHTATGGAHRCEAAMCHLRGATRGSIICGCGIATPNQQRTCVLRMYTTTHLNTLTATHCNTLQHTHSATHTLQHTETHCNTLQEIHIATHYNTYLNQLQQLQHPSTMRCVAPRAASGEYNTLQHAATRCNTLQHTATH